MKKHDKVAFCTQCIPYRQGPQLEVANYTEGHSQQTQGRYHFDRSCPEKK